jgi:hypothetical protein
MADTTVKVITPAASYALLTLDELKAAYRIDPADTTRDAQLQMLIDQYSDVVATMCNRVFAKETVEERWRGDAPPYENYRIFLSRWPVDDDDIESVNAPDGTLIDPANYEIESASGKLTLLGSWSEPIVVTYTGGYELPDEAPPALKQAAQLLIQAAGATLARGLTTGVRSISHKESRVQYFDPLGGTGKSAHTPLSMAGDTVQALLYHYMRFQV